MQCKILATASARANQRLLSRDAESARVEHEPELPLDEGEEQLARYEQGLDSLVPPGTRRHLVFLTKKGHDEQTATEDWRNVSFEDLAIAFYRAFRTLDPLTPGYQVLRYYLATVFRDMADWEIPLSAKSPSPVLALYYLSRVGLTPGR